MVGWLPVVGVLLLFLQAQASTCWIPRPVVNGSEWYTDFTTAVATGSTGTCDWTLGNSSAVASNCGFAAGSVTSRGLQLVGSNYNLTDYIASVYVTPAVFGFSFGLLFHYQDADNYMAFEWSFYPTAAPKGTIRIKRRTSGLVFTQLFAISGQQPSLLTAHLFQIRSTKGNITMFLDGVYFARVYDPFFKSGAVGIDAAAVPGTVFSNLTVETLGLSQPCGACGAGSEPVVAELSVPSSIYDVDVTCSACPQGKYNDGITGGYCSSCPVNQGTSSVGASSFASCMDCMSWNDNFNDGDYNGWQQINANNTLATWSVTNGQLNVTSVSSSVGSGSDNDFASMLWYSGGTTWTSYKVTASVSAPSNPYSTVGIAFHVQDDSDYYSIDWNWGRGIRRLRKHTSSLAPVGIATGTFSTLFSDTISTTPMAVNVSINVVSGTFRLLWNGAIVWTYTDSSFNAMTTGSIGALVNNATTSVLFDDFTINFDQRYSSRCVCQTGEYLNPVVSISGVIVSDCVICRAGQYSNMTNAPSCTNCTAGYYSPSAGSSVCSACGPFAYNVPGSSVCDLCRPGYQYYTNTSLITGCVTVPLITSNSMKINGILGVTVLTTTQGGDTLEFDIIHPTKQLTITSSDLVVTLYLNYLGNTVYQWNCPLILSGTNETHIKCRIPAVIGTNIFFSVGIKGTTLQSLNSTQSFDTPAPTIKSGTIRSTTSLTPSTVYTSSTTNGDELVFNGTNFGSWSSSSYWQVTYGPTGTSYPCSVVTSKSNDNIIHCTTLASYQVSSNDLSGLVFQVSIFGRSVTGTDVYNYPETPSITSIRGCSDTPAGYTGSDLPVNGTSNCPTLGGVTVTISGKKLNTPMIFTVNGKTCTNAVVVIEGSQWTCVLPVGAGYRQNVIGSQNQLSSLPNTGLWYAKASAYNITGCMGISVDNTKVTECNRTGGDIVTIMGMNFGAGISSPPSVLIGGVLLDTVVQTSVSSIEVTLGKGNRLDTAVLILQSAGEVTTTSLTIDYHQCQPGQYESGYNCLPCASGYFSGSSGVTACSSCAAGYYAPGEGAIICKSCDPGKFSTELNSTICAECPEGSYQVSSGQIGCDKCKQGYYANSTGQATCSECQGGTATTPGSYSASEGATVCTLCIGSKFQNFPHATDCTECDTNQYVVRRTQASLPECASIPDNVYRSNGTIVASEGSWIAYSDGELTSHLCLPNMCVADSCTIVTPVVDGISYQACCGKNRKPAEYNIICGECLDGFYEWSGTCVACDNPYYGWIILYIIVSWVFLLIFHRISQTTRGETKIVIYYIQMLLVFYGPTTSFVSWLSVTNANVFNTGGAQCVMPLGPAGKLLMGLWVPLVVVAELFATFCIHIIYWYFRHSRADTAAGRTGSDRVKFHKSPYLRTLFALFIFSYNSVTSTVLTYFSCTDINGSSVVSQYPALHCDSSQYKSLRGLALALVFVVVAGFPVTVLVGMLYMNRKGKVYTRKFYERYGIIYETYRKDRYYWEAVNLFRRTALIAIGVIPSDLRAWRYATMSAVNLLLLGINVFLRPFELPNDQKMETFSLTILTLITVMLTPTTSTQYSTSMIVGFCFLVYVPLAGMLSWFVWNRTHPPKVEHEHWLKELKLERETHAQRQSERAAGRGRGSVSSNRKSAPDEIGLASMSSRSALLPGASSSAAPSPALTEHLTPVAIAVPADVSVTTTLVLPSGITSPTSDTDEKSPSATTTATAATTTATHTTDLEGKKNEDDASVLQSGDGDAEAAAISGSMA